MIDLHPISREFRIPFCADGRSLFLPPGRVFVVGDDLGFSATGIEPELTAQIVRLGTTLYRDFRERKLTVVMSINRVPELVKILRPQPPLSSRAYRS